MVQKFSVPQDKIKFSFLQQEHVLELCYKPCNYYEDSLLLGSCNGLILVSYEKDHMPAGAYRFAVINPLSKQRYDLPPIHLNVKDEHVDLIVDPCEAAGIGFDDSTNTFKTVFSFQPNKKVLYTLVHSSGTSSWRKIPHAYPTSGEGVYSHGRLYWFASRYFDYDYGFDNDNDFRKIVWFDVKTEKFELIDSPPNPEKGNYSFFGFQLAGLNGEVGFARFNPICIKLWILKPEEKWALHCCFDLSVIVPRHYDYDLEVSGCWNKDGDILFTCMKYERLFVYTLETGDLRQVGKLSNECYDIRMYQTNLVLLNASAYSITQKKKKIEEEASS
ncbi:hypothetical protein QVD17_35876 [Tagetes erecta]|uniref:F-box associated beta-propeller type 3 domain-containing protein n=1 Tax=Tagetes erecta TaxID=13708 RepID=A0AAD8NBG5_TARER|nr:hypothetical protein QVD17_35876 [Tagetes erecta]